MTPAARITWSGAVDRTLVAKHGVPELEPEDTNLAHDLPQQECYAQTLVPPPPQ